MERTAYRLRPQAKSDVKERHPMKKSIAIVQTSAVSSAELKTLCEEIMPGIPVWMTGSESKFPDMPYVIFPGNVGEVRTLTDVVRVLMGK